MTRRQERFQKNLGTWFFMQVMKPAAYIMTRRMLLGPKERAETLRRERERQSDSGQAVA